MKKFGIALLASLSLLCLGASPVSANHRTHYHVHTKRVMRLSARQNVSRKFYVGRIEILSLRMGASNQSMKNLNHGMKRQNTKQLQKRYQFLIRTYEEFNGTDHVYF